MTEWVVSDEDLGCDGTYFSYKEIVRCKECKWWKLSEYNTFGIHICKKFSGVRGEHDFCSRGERREE